MRVRLRPLWRGRREMLWQTLDGTVSVAYGLLVISRSNNQRRYDMSNEQKRAEGDAEELGGKLKKGIGKIIGNEQMEAEGKATEIKGEARQKATE